MWGALRLAGSNWHSNEFVWVCLSKDSCTKRSNSLWVAFRLKHAEQTKQARKTCKHSQTMSNIFKLRLEPGLFQPLECRASASLEDSARVWTPKRDGDLLPGTDTLDTGQMHYDGQSGSHLLILSDSPIFFYPLCKVGQLRKKLNRRRPAGKTTKMDTPFDHVTVGMRVNQSGNIILHSRRKWILLGLVWSLSDHSLPKLFQR